MKHCSRSVCRVPGAPCRHTDDDRPYCVSCARGINKQPGQEGLVRIPKELPPTPIEFAPGDRYVTMLGDLMTILTVDDNGTVTYVSETSETGETGETIEIVPPVSAQAFEYFLRATPGFLVLHKSTLFSYTMDQIKKALSYLGRTDKTPEFRKAAARDALTRAIDGLDVP